MIKIITVPFEELEIYLNKPWYSFLSNYQDSFIFKYTEKTSRQIVAITDTERFFNLDDEWIDNYSRKYLIRLIKITILLKLK